MAKKLTQDEFKRKINELTNGEYIVLGEYINNKTKVKLHHIICNKSTDVVPHTFFSKGTRCRYCNDVKRRKTNEQFLKEIYELVANEYTFLSIYKGCNTKIPIKHNTCGHDYEIAPKIFLRGDRCPSCFGKFLKTTKQFKREVWDLVGDEYIVLGEYTISKQKVKMRHAICENEIFIAPDNFLHGKRCSICNESKGEKKVREYLTGYTFIPQKEFEGLIGLGGGLLSYDFYLPNQNLLIEYQGEQHSYFIKGVHGDIHNFEKQQEHDRRKREFAKQNDIGLLEIWHWDYDKVEEILENELKQVI